jgi:hypothetical protein
MLAKKLLSTAIAAATALGVTSARADALSDIFTQGHVDGELRAYNFNRIYQTSAVPDAQAFSGALLLNATTATFGDGFSLGGSLITANSFGTQANTISHVDTTLMGPNDSVTALGQAYVQYQKRWLMVRGGYQYLNTPWMGGSDSRVLPASYNAILVGMKPAKGWDIYALRSFGWKSRTSDSYFSDNNYYTATYSGDLAYGGIGGLPATARDANGVVAIGTTYANGGLKSQAWYYNFLQFARMGYVDGNYRFKTGTNIDPFIAAQYVTESGGGANNRLVQNNVAPFGVPGNSVKSRVWGINTGIIIPNGQFDLSYNKIASEAGALGNGALISPYTAGYATDPLYTTSMIRGLVEEGPGYAWKAKAAYNFFDKKLQLVAGYAKYVTELRGNSHDLYFDIIYNFHGYLKGLTLRNRWERSAGGVGLNPGNQSFIYNRVMISYKF